MAKEERFDWDYELSKSRVVLLTGEIGEDTVHQVCTKLTILDDKNPEYEDEDSMASTSVGVSTTQIEPLTRLLSDLQIEQSSPSLSV